MIFLERSACCPRSQKSPPVQKFHSYHLTSPGKPVRSIPGLGDSRNIEFGGNFEAYSHIIIICNPKFLIPIYIALFFWKYPWLKTKQFLSKFGFSKTFILENFNQVRSSGMNDIFWLAGTFVTWDSKQEPLYKNYSGYTEVLKIEKLYHGFEISPTLTNSRHMWKIRNISK